MKNQNQMWVVAMVVSFYCSAQSWAGAEVCGLPELSNDKNIIPTAHLEIQDSSDLDGDQKQQLVMTAKALVPISANYVDIEASEITSASKAIEFLKEGSDDQNLVMVDFGYEGSDFTSVEFYSEGKHFGVIFASGTHDPIAFIKDSVVECL